MRVGILAALVISILPVSTGAETPDANTWSVDLVQLNGDQLGWGGVFLGMTRGEVESNLGQELPVELDRYVLSCGEYKSVVDLFGRKVQIQWSSPESNGTVQSIWVPTTPAEHTTSVNDLVQRLTSRLTNLSQTHPADPEDVAAVLGVPKNPRHQVMVKSIREHFLYVTLEACFG